LEILADDQGCGVSVNAGMWIRLGPELLLMAVLNKQNMK
jgi:hypothetical protein